MKPHFKMLCTLMLASLFVACGATTQTSSRATVQKPAATKEYRLDTGDLIRIEIQAEANTLLEIRLDETGVITYNQLKDPITVKGKTLSELKGYLLSKLKPDFYKDPNLQVTIAEYRPFFINGQVNNPGAYPYQPGLTVAKAITLAGGKTDRAGDIDIVRADKTEVSDAGLQEIVKPGDIISVDDSWL